MGLLCDVGTANPMGTARAHGVQARYGELIDPHFGPTHHIYKVYNGQKFGHFSVVAYM